LISQCNQRHQSPIPFIQSSANDVSHAGFEPYFFSAVMLAGNPLPFKKQKRSYDLVKQQNIFYAQKIY
jgi:hypothetical protein